MLIHGGKRDGRDHGLIGCERTQPRSFVFSFVRGKQDQRTDCYNIYKCVVIRSIQNNVFDVLLTRSCTDEVSCVCLNERGGEPVCRYRLCLCMSIHPGRRWSRWLERSFGLLRLVYILKYCTTTPRHDLFCPFAHGLCDKNGGHGC